MRQPSLRPAELRLTVRPPRRLVFVPLSEELPWQYSFAGALANQCTVWGGIGDLVLPLDAATSDSEVFWAIAALHDADVYELHTPTTGDLQILAPILYERRHSQVAAQIDDPGIEPEAVARYLEGEALAEQRLGRRFVKDIMRRLGPMCDYDMGVESTASIGYAPAIGVGDLLELPEQIRQTTTSLGPDAAALLAAEFGLLPPDLGSMLAERGCVLKPRSVDNDHSLRTALYTSAGQQGTHPWSVTQRQLEFYAAGFAPRAPIIVAGDDPWDFAFFYALRRLHGLVWWAPQTVLDSEVLLDGLLRRVKHFARKTSSHPKLTSISAPETMPVAIADRLAADPRGRFVPELVVASWRDVLPSKPGRLAESGQIDLPQSALLKDDRTSPIPTPMPVSIRHRDESETTWVVEATVNDWPPLRHPRAAQRLVSGAGVSPWMTRATARGVAWQSDPSMRMAGGPLAASIVRPQLALPPLIDQIGAAFADRFWSVARSDKGAYAQRAADLLGGPRQFAAVLSEPWLQRLLFTFMSGKKEEGASGRWLSAEGRRVVTLSDLHDILSGPDDPALDTEALIDGLRSSEVLQIGSVLKCRRCRQAVWYDVEAFGRSFACSRCRLEQPADAEAWQGVEPVWSYRIDEAVLQFVLHRGDLPVLALAPFISEETELLATAFEIDIRPTTEERGSELDIVAIADGELFVGEASHSPKLKPVRSDEKARIRRLADVADTLGAAHVILANGADWDPKTAEAARAAFPGPCPKLHLQERSPFVPRPARLVGSDR
jgi:hypothetical protein